MAVGHLATDEPIRLDALILLALAGGVLELLGTLWVVLGLLGLR